MSQHRTRIVGLPVVIIVSEGALTLQVDVRELYDAMTEEHTDAETLNLALLAQEHIARRQVVTGWHD